MTLDKLEVGKDAVIESVGGKGALRRHFLDMGLTPGTEVTMMKKAPMGDPIELRLRSYELTLRLADAAQIEISGIHDTDTVRSRQAHLKDIPHPQVGEMGIYHVRKKGNELREGEPLTFGLIGNQNCGKTTLFNQLTGANQHVGNFPGVTVDRKDGQIKNHPEATVTDLPGIYSLSPYTNEEIVTRDFLIQNKPRGIINIVDATNIERNLYLTMQLIEMDIPMVLALNMMDEVRENGGTIQVNRLEEALGIPVIPISAAKNEGIGELIEHAIHVARYDECPGRLDFCDANGENGQAAIHRCIHAVVHLIEDHAKKAEIPARFAATKLVEGDKLILQQLGLDRNEEETLEHMIHEMEEECAKDREAALADMRFKFIEKVCTQTVVKPTESKAHARSVKADKILTGKYTALPAFAAIMGLIFWLTFGVIGAGLSDWLSVGIDIVTDFADRALTAYGLNPVVHSLIIDGIFAGVGSVLSFLPIIVVLFFFLSILEDSGYMARIAFVMDKLLRKIGLSGRSFVPMIIGFGCKAGMMPLQAWLPTAHPVAPAPASAVLSGIITKAGILGMIRVTFYLFNQDFLRGTWAQLTIIILALATVFVGSMLAYKEQLLKKRLAYSTVSQVSYVIFGIMILTPQGLSGALLQVIFHAIAKNALFLAAGAIIYKTGAIYVKDLKGMGKKMPIVMWCFTIASLSLIGIPPTGGFVAKWDLAVGALSPEFGGVLGYVGPAILLVSALLTAGYLLPIVRDAFFPGKDFDYETLEKKEANAYMTVPLILLCIGVVGLGMFPMGLQQVINGITSAVM